jgi:hypothetical protein
MLTPKIYLTGFHDICTVVTSKQVIDGLSAGCGSLLNGCAKESNYEPS